MEVEDTTHPNRKDEYLFVYGTLRKDASNVMSQVLAKHARFVGGATFQGKLFDLGNYPGTISSDSPQDLVHGEVYALEPMIRNQVLAILDEYEGCSFSRETLSEFRREHVTVTLDDGRSISSWIYLYNLSEIGTPIPSGDYSRYLKVKGI
jgi:gamma-glutamylcyclotransferase (GGCT)/AIG2-like uncharacterized protein YtfP